MSTEESVERRLYPGVREDAPTWWGEPKSRTVSWYWGWIPPDYDPAAPGLTYVQGIIDGVYPPPPIAATIPLRPVSAREGEVVFRLLADESLLNPAGIVHGGVMATAMDTAMGVSLASMVPVGQPFATIEMSVSYLKPMPFDGDEVEIVGKVLRVGRKIAFAEAKAYNAAGELIGSATSSLARIGA